MSAKRIKRKSKQTAQYIPLEDIKIIDDAFLTEINNVRMKLSGCDDEKLINAFNEVLVNGYKAAIELKALEREVDYNIKFAEIEAREREQKPWRRGWWWRLIFQPLTNRAQDIIERRAELEADIVLSAEERVIEIERNSFISDSGKKLSKRELKQKLKEAIKKADETETNEAFDEPQDVPPVQEEKPEQEKGQLPGQMTIADVQKLTPVRRPRPPRSCRK